MYLAIDIGATKTLIALFSARGRVVRCLKFPTALVKAQFLQDLRYHLKEFQSDKLRAVVVAVPGHVKVETRHVPKKFTGFGSKSAPAPNINEQIICSAKFGNREWGWFDLITPIKDLFTCPIYFENDANLAAIYESRGLKGRTLFLTFSTGVGGGLAQNGQLLLTDKDRFEPGHTICEYQGEKAEWEDIAACSALERVYGVEQATDLKSRRVMLDIAMRIGVGLPELIATYQPANVVIGGPLGLLFPDFKKFLPPLNVKYRAPKRPLESVIYGCYLFGKNQG